MNFEEFERLLLEGFAAWSTNCGQPLPPDTRTRLKQFLNTELDKPENRTSIYPRCISDRLYTYFTPEDGYGLEDILSFARFLQDELGLS